MTAQRKWVEAMLYQSKERTPDGNLNPLVKKKRTKDNK